MPKLSSRQQTELMSLANTRQNGVSGQKHFISGFPTYEALKRRGMVTISPSPFSRVRWVVEMTDLGWQYLGKTRPAPDEDDV